MFKFKLICVLLMLLIAGCGQTYRPSIVDIRDEPYPIDWSPRQPEAFADVIRGFQL
jgi:hypothetical protein